MFKSHRSAAKRHDEDLSAWYYLGLALERQGKSGAARKAYEKAGKLGAALGSSQLSKQEGFGYGTFPQGNQFPVSAGREKRREVH